MADLTITLDTRYQVRTKHWLEKELDETMNKLGFTRTGSGSNEKRQFEIYYRQFAEAK